MDTKSDLFMLFLALTVCLAAMVLIQVFVPAEGRDPEITKALSYVATAVVGAMAGAARRTK